MAPPDGDQHRHRKKPWLTSRSLDPQPAGGSMTLLKSRLPRLHDPAKLLGRPPAGGCMTLQNRWLHHPAKICPRVAA